MEQDTYLSAYQIQQIFCYNSLFEFMLVDYILDSRPLISNEDLGISDIVTSVIVTDNEHLCILSHPNFTV